MLQKSTITMDWGPCLVWVLPRWQLSRRNELGGDAILINMKILTVQISEETRKPITWLTLIGALHELDMNNLAHDITEKLESRLESSQIHYQTFHAYDCSILSFIIPFASGSIFTFCMYIIVCITAISLLIVFYIFKCIIIYNNMNNLVHLQRCSSEE